MSLPTVILDSKAPTPFRYLFLGSSIIFLLITLGSSLVPLLQANPLLSPLLVTWFVPLGFDPATYDPTLVTAILLPAITLLGTGALTPLLAYWQPIEKYWKNRLKSQDKDQPLVGEKPFRSDVFRYAIMQRDRESYFNFVVGFVSFTVLLIANLIPGWLPLILRVMLILTTFLGMIAFGWTARKQWQKTFGRLFLARFTYLVKQEIKQSTQKSTLHHVIAELLECESKGDWNRLLDAEAELLRDARGIVVAYKMGLDKLSNGTLESQVTLVEEESERSYLGNKLHLDLYVDECGIFLVTIITIKGQRFHGARLITSEGKTVRTDFLEALKKLVPLLDNLLKKIVERENLIPSLYD